MAPALPVTCLAHPAKLLNACPQGAHGTAEPVQATAFWHWSHNEHEAKRGAQQSFMDTVAEYAPPIPGKWPLASSQLVA